MTATLPRIHNPAFLIFVRHGQTDWNREGRMQGQKDIPLNPLGRSQADDNGLRLSEYLSRNGLTPETFDFVASPLGRTRDTMERVRKGMGLAPSEYRHEDLLKELTFGAWEGHTLEELAMSHPELVELRRKDKYQFAPPGGGESYEMLRQRIAKWLVTVDKPTICVAHGGVMRVMRGMLEGLPPEMVSKLDVPQDRVFVWKDSKGDWF
ncbi:histidine phosphatase family protein [Roseibium sp.]|uniref:histidine phosphatase family protein n=1 Tax=Roseibium sp. TaxID=1936156 RepID=UPI003A96DA3B